MKNIGVAIHERSSAAMLHAIREAERLDIPTVWLTTGAGPDAMMVFAAAAAVTQKVRFGTAIVPTYPRHPLVLAQQTADIALLAPGRFVLGLGPSHKNVIEGRYGLRFDRPLAHLREFVEIVRRLLTGEQTDYKGTWFEVHSKLNQGAQVPVIISALRATSFELAGEISDGAVSWLCPAPYMGDVALPALKRGIQRAGQGKAKLIGHAFLALTEDERDLQQGVEEFLPIYPRLTNYQEMFAAAGYPEARQGTWTKQMVDAVVLHGNEEQCAKKVEAFIKRSGCDELVLSVMLTGADRQVSMRRSLEWVGKFAAA